MLTRFVVAQMRKPRSRASWHRWYAVYRALPHWKLLSARVRMHPCMSAHAGDCAGPRHAHHWHYRTLGHERPLLDVSCLCARHHAQIHRGRGWIA